MATLGYTSIGATTGTVTVTAGSQQPVFCKFTATEYGVMNSISFYCNALSGTANMRAAIWYAGLSGANQYLLLGAQDLAATLISTTPEWATTLFSPFQLSAGSTYHLMFFGDADFNFYYDAGATNQRYTGAGFTYPSVVSPESGGATAADQVSVYATYDARVLTPYNYNQIDRISTIQRVKSIRI